MSAPETIQQTATAAFTFDRWDSVPIISEPINDADGFTLSRTSMAKTFTGELRGTSVGELLMATAPEDSAAYSGFERVTATIGDRSGSFVLRHVAHMSGGGGAMELPVMPGSGTGGLTGLTGEAEIVRHDDGTHTFTLRYALPT